MAGTSRPSNIAEWGSEIDRLIDSESETSEIDYALQDFQQLSSSDSEDEPDVQTGGGDAPNQLPNNRNIANVRNNRPRSNRKRPDMVWEGMENYTGQREVFFENCGPQIQKNSILETFLFFFDDNLLETIVTETNRSRRCKRVEWCSPNIHGCGNGYPVLLVKYMFFWQCSCS